MNNEDPSKNKKDQTSASSEWAEFVDDRGRNALPKNSDETESVEHSAPDDLTPQRLDDLELDGQLRMLGMMSDPEDSFVSKVVAQTQSDTVPLNRPRLPVVGPTLVPRNSEIATNSAETLEEVSEMITETSKAVAGTSFATPADDGIDLPLPSASLPSEVRHRRPVALLALLATILFVGCFLGSMWWFGSAPNIAESPTSDGSVGKFVRLKGISDPSDDSRKDEFEVSPGPGGDGNRFTADEALVEQSMDQDTGPGSVAAVKKAVNQEDKNRTFENTKNANSNPTLVDAKQKLDSSVSSTYDGMPGLGDEGKLKDQTIEEYSAGDAAWDLKFDWNLALKFHRNGVGSVTLNGEPVKAIFLKDNAAFLLRKVASELRRRVRFLENRLGSKISGSIAVEESTYRFDDLSELEATVDKVDRQIAKLDVRTLTVAELMKVRTGYREEIFAKRNKFGSIHLAEKNLKFYTEDEAFTISSVLSASETVLRDLAKERLEWEEDFEDLSPKSKLKSCIKPKPFQHFANGGFLLPPDPKITGQSIAGIQNLGPAELQRMLQGAPSVELFRNGGEFQQAKDFVYSNGPPEMRLRLSIDKIDRTLNDKTLVVTEAAQEALAARKARELRELRNLLAEGGSFGDGIPMEPLKAVLAERSDLQGLPLVMGDACKSDASETSDLKQVSFSVGQTIGAFNGSLGSRDAAQNDAFRNLTIKEMVAYCMKDQAHNPSSQKLKTIDQILQIDHARLRLEMIGALGKSGSEAAVKLLVNKAKFDLEPKVRIAATDALSDVDPKEIRGLLLEGLQYPWHVVAEHSAEALVRLDDQDAVPQLIEMLDLPHPHYPFENNGTVVQQELVGINHMRNCLLCHAPSMSSFDSVRGLIPHASRPLPRHYYDTAGMAADVPYAVRADVTYLEQDFSVLQSVKNPGPWPSEQRIDYVVQKKKLTPLEAEKVARQVSAKPNRNWNAIVFALRELTGETPEDNSSGNWRMLTEGREQNGN